jgi:hypothetical protein
MRPKYPVPSDGGRNDHSSIDGGEFAMDEHANNVFRLLQENARLRAHIAKLSSILKTYLK